MKWLTSIFGANPKSHSLVSPETAAIFERLHAFLGDERAQNSQLPSAYRATIEAGEDCDQIANASGEFGRSFSNPIPVNGPIGQILYLSNLRCASDTPIMFHRIGSRSDIDVFEVVSLDAARWDILFLDLYHPRKSSRTPSGYNIAKGRLRQDLFFGTSEFVEGFPQHIQDAARDAFHQWLGVPMRNPALRQALEQESFVRPKHHQDQLDLILSTLDISGM